MFSLTYLMSFALVIVPLYPDTLMVDVLIHEPSHGTPSGMNILSGFKTLGTGGASTAVLEVS